MKNWIVLLLLWISAAAFAQDTIPTVTLPADMTVHFISPEPIQYVDISTKDIIGDLALPNVLRLRLKDSCRHFERAVVTIAGEKFLAQYRLMPGNAPDAVTVDILPAAMRPLDIAGIGLSQNQLKQLSLDVMAIKAKHPVEKSEDFGIEASANHIYATADYLFIDIGFRNKTRIPYTIDGIRFRVEDKKVTKASNVQSVEVKPVFVLQQNIAFDKTYRNIYVFKKMSFPGNKVLNIELSERQPSGRIINLKIRYQDILNADSIPN